MLKTLMMFWGIYLTAWSFHVDYLLGFLFAFVGGACIGYGHYRKEK